MNQLNSLIIEGNIVRTPEIKETANKSKLATFSMAVNRYYKKSDGTFEQEVSYFDVEAWGNLVESVEKNASKGCGCRVVGRLKQDRWKDGNGKLFSKVSIVAEHIEFMKNATSSEEPKSSELADNQPVEEQVPPKKKSAKFDKTKLFGNKNDEIASEDDLPKAVGFDIF
ncbi:single stranded DNA-binding protein (ssb) [Treponema sp. JC4]|uniref:single-stranded DNA-binding protein n=1 Tax=Treponema sp. JC4 TaxID=1124982 RepID=UPI00025B07AC|nr:single-stranded DNA-binding protein [Treponema sp. JC4]EID84219.1 single stranded DNA-binding protein (ssb) [Treponema sp. JC4]